ncbi:hypothetical protein [Vibrio mexicanus]|uniref:hypothetical protein n=1 Tax=Vibrio mexicanus TaxID=1004326 RepID=UPI000AA8BF2C|nr:hypothetical protein [Vibrio mexicanus]
MISATIGNAGSISDFYIISDVSIQTVGGGWAGFGYGAVNGYPGASADIGKMGVPTHIKGTWSKGWYDEDEITYFRIDAPIDSELAEKKMRTLQNYYENHERKNGVMQVVVDEERIQVMFTKKCHEPYDDCAPAENSNPQRWVVKSPTGHTDVVVLFDGKGESSPMPFQE